MRILKKLFAALLLCMLPAFIFSSEYVNASDEVLGYAYTVYNNANGLPTSEANAVVQSDDGFIWIGGYAGLIRYDGKEFYRFDSGSGIDSVASLFIDSRSRLWVGTNESGIALYEDGNFTIYGKESGITSASVKSIAEDADGHIIFATTGGLYYIDEELGAISVGEKKLNGEYICALKSGEDGSVYGVTLTGAVFEIRDLELYRYWESRDFSGDIAYCICPASAGQDEVLVGTNIAEIYRLNMETGEIIGDPMQTAGLSTINDICIFGDRLWICSDTGIGYVEDINSSGKLVILRDSPLNNSIDSMMRDYEGNFWFTSSRQGLMKMTKSRFVNLTAGTPVDGQVVNATCMHQDELYIGTDNGLYIWKNERMVENEITSLLENVRIRDIKVDSKDNLWFGTFSDKGLIKLSPSGVITSYTVNDGLPSNMVRAIEELKGGDMMVATSGGTILIGNGIIKKYFNGSNGIKNTEILTICEDEDGVLYLGSDGNGIYRIKDGFVEQIGIENGLDSEVILKIKSDPVRGGQWIITSNSIGYYKDETVTTISAFPYSNNFDLYFGDNDVIWVLSSNGVYSVKGAEMLSGKGELGYRFYDIANSGLPFTATANAKSFLSSSGLLFIAGTEGVTLMNINQKDEVGKNAKLAIPFAEIDGEMVYFHDGDTLNLSSNAKRLTIYGNVLSYGSSALRVRYYLSGFDERMEVCLGRELPASTYTNLNAGSYVYHLGIMDEDTGKVSEEITLKIEKEPRLLERGWVWGIIIVLFLAIVSAIAVVVSRREMKRQTEKLRIEQEESVRFSSQMMNAFAKAIDFKDKYTNGHSERVAQYSKKIAASLGMAEARQDEIYAIAILHDIGKIVIPDSILNKDGKLTDEEYAIIKQHSSYGYEILKEMTNFPELALGAGYHHERIDGKGYPDGLKGNEIPYIARIIAVADTFDAMNSTRSYRRRMPLDVILNELIRVKGTQLDSELVDILIKLIENGELFVDNVH